MRSLLALTLLIGGFSLGAIPCAHAGEIAPHGKGVQVIADEAHRRVDVTIDGKSFTSYVWPASLKKPVLYPLITDEDVTVTRGFPLDPRPGERVDHPHHAGMWFNYGNVNGFDFWNNSDAIKPESRAKMGTILQKKIVSATSGPDKGELVVDSVWITGQNQEILTERTRYVFSRQKGARVIDQITTLQAQDKAVFHDDKEGLLGMRVAHWLESPEEKGGTFMDASGRPTQVANVDTSGATGVYLTSEGVKGAAVWGTRGQWCVLTGHDATNHVVSIGVVDHAENPGYPTYWHARGYGLFAANPLGRSIFDPKQPAFNYTLQKGDSATFRYRVVLFSHAAGVEEMNGEAKSFAAEYR
ncbi:MAG: PmoA family protein [Acidobacteriota bacterium]|nr:PmoA family protein [Acidobacteriota bacterium]